MSKTITLRSEGLHGPASVEIDAACGGRISQITVRDVPLLINPDGIRDRYNNPTAWGSYPMAPWAGRIRHGQFRFHDVDRELELNCQDGPHAGPADELGSGPSRRHAIHGTVFAQPWTIDEQSPDFVTMSCPLSPSDLPAESLLHFGWTFGGTARQRIELLDGQLRCDLSIEVDHNHADDTVEEPQHAALAFLGEVGWHPWFNKPESISFHPDAMYERDAIGLPTGQLITPTPGPWDDCFVNTAPVTLHYDRQIAPLLTISSDCDHWVIYSEPDHATCVEPQSGPPDSFNIRPRLVTATHPLRRTMNIAW